MKIAIFTDTYYPKVDGIVTSIMNSTQELADKGHEIIIFAPKYKEKKSLKSHQNIKVYRFFSFSLFSYEDVKIPIPNITQVIKMIKEFGPDIIHLHTPGTMGLLAIFCSKLYGIPSIGTYHTLLSEQITYLSLKRLTKLDKLIEKIKSKRTKTKKVRKSNFERKLEDILKIESVRKFIDMVSFKKTGKENLGKKMIWKVTCNFYNKCDLVTVPSKSIRNELRKYGVTAPIRVLSNGIDISIYSPKKNYHMGKIFKILHVGRISFEKNTDVLIRSLNLLSMERKNVFLTIVGEGPALQSLKNLAHSLGLENKINFTGCIFGKKLVRMYQKSDVFVTASTMETQGLVVLEAMACGLPVIGVKKYAIPDLVKHSINGYIAKPFNEDEIKEYLIRLVNNPTLIKKFGKKSAEIAKEHELGNVVKKWGSLYKKLKIPFDS